MAVELAEITKNQEFNELNGYLNCLSYLLNAYSYSEDYPNALSTSSKVLELNKMKFGKNNVEYAYALNKYGYINYCKRTRFDNERTGKRLS